MDMQLIQQAERTSCLDWGKIDSLIAQAKDPDTASELRQIQVNKYHQEEYMI